MIVRRLTLGDLATHVALRDELWRDGADVHAAELRALFGRPTFVAFGALDGDTPIGFAEATLREYVDGVDTSPAAYLEGIYIAPAHRCTGVAVALVGAVMRWGRDHGCTELGSDALSEDVESHAWHARTGFAELERVVRYAMPIADARP